MSNLVWDHDAAPAPTKLTLRALLVRLLNSACVFVDELLYRPAAVRLGLSLPRWWNCNLARVSASLDQRWGTGFWRSESSPARPGPPCDACGRRPAIFALDVAGGPDDIVALQLCGWCHVRAPVLTPTNIASELHDARRRSVAWTWRWRSTR